MSHLHVAQLAYNRPLAIDPSKLQVILGVLNSRTGIEAPVLSENVPPGALQAPARRGVTLARVPLTAELDAMPMDDIEDPEDEKREEANVEGGAIAVISITGTLVNRIAMEPMSSFASYERISGYLDKCAADPAILGILLRVESFGGDVSGAFDCADAVLSARDKKPVWCAVDDSAYSAAYLLASQCERITISRTGGVGSVGVIAVHYDFSRYEEKAGIKPTAIFRGSKKNWFTPDKPLDKEAAAWLEAEVDGAYERFVQYAAAGRDMTEKAIRETEAGLFTGNDAVAAGMADQIATFKQSLSDFAASLRGTGQQKLKPAAKAVAQPTKESVMAETNDAAEVVAAVAVAAAAPPASPDAAATSAAESVRLQEIIDLCAIAGKSNLVQKFASEKKSVAEVRAALLTARVDETAANEEIVNMAGNGTGTGKAEPSLMEVVQQVYGPKGAN